MTSCVSRTGITGIEEQARHSACDALLELAPRSGKNIANHAAQVPKQIPDVPTALASCEMHGGGARDKPDVVARQPEAGTEIHILVIQVITGVKSTHGGKSVPSKQHEHAAYPIRGDTFLADFVVSLRLPNQRQKRIRGNANVGIQHTEEVSAGKLECSVVIGREASWTRVSDRFNGKRKRVGIERQRFLDVEREDDFDSGWPVQV